MENGIRTTDLNQELSTRLSGLQSGVQSNKRYRRLFSKKNRPRTIKYTVLAVNAVLLVSVMAFVTQKPHTTSGEINLAASTEGGETATVNPLDELSSADIAVNIAQSAFLPESTSVINKADTVNAQLTISQSDNIVTAKPQVIATALKSRADITTYTTTSREDIAEIAARFGITSDTIRWSNNLSDDFVPAGTKLVISPITGIVYKVKPGDTLGSILSRYRVNESQMVAFNDIEGRDLPFGEYIVLPNASPVAQATSNPSQQNVANSGGFAWGGYQAQYGSNGYDYGYCTWYVKNRRPDLPNNLGNASTWKVLAQRAGFSTGSTPRPGAVIWTPPRDYYGHVGYVESVKPNGSVVISEMNTVGWGVVSRKTLSASQARQYGYIY